MVEVFGGEPNGVGGAGVAGKPVPVTPVTASAPPGVAGPGPRCASCMNGLSDSLGTVAAASIACVLLLVVALGFGRPSGRLPGEFCCLPVLLPVAEPLPPPSALEASV